MTAKPSIIADPAAALRQARGLLGSDPKAAARQASQLLESFPGEPAILRVLGAALRRQGDVRQAEQYEKQAVDASIRSPAHREAARAVASGDKKKAVAILEALISRDESDVVALVMLGLQLSVDNAFDLAEPLLRKAVEAAPADLAARMALAEHLHRTKRPAEALDMLEALGPAGDAPNVLSLRANILRDLGRQDEEVAILEGLAASEQRPESYRIRLGHAFRNLGRTEESIAAYRSVIAVAPYEGTSWWSLANLKTVKFSDSDIAAMEQGLTHSQAPTVNRIRLHFALGKALEDRGEIERSFAHYAEGNRLRDEIATYRPEKISEWVDQAEALYTPEFFADRAGFGHPASDPIFIIGMQRSGSTLIEQILDSHPQIEGTAELTDFPAIVREQSDLAHRRGHGFHEHLRRMAPKAFDAPARDYVERTRVYRLTDKPFFTDKMPVNWLYVGVIALWLPNARIIDVRRNPLDCCFSNWKQLYGSGLEHSYSMENMGRYYADYVRLMRLMDRVRPGHVHRLIYDRLVDEPETHVRALLDYLGLPFDDACLAFHEKKRSVRTISAEQVRQPINRKGLDQWRPFEQWLGPMKRALGPVLDDWDK